MKQIHLSLAAAGFAVICTLVVIHSETPPAMRKILLHDSVPDEVLEAIDLITASSFPVQEGSPSLQRQPPFRVTSRDISSVPSGEGGSDPKPTTSSVHFEAEDAETNTASSADNTPAVQLAWNVRLPAAIMDSGRRRTENPGAVPTPADEAVRGIETTFYQNVAATVPEVANPPEAAPINGTDNGESTTVITPGPEVEQARNNANELYRALFGDAAYNRQTMDSAIEVQLPENQDIGPKD